MNTLFGKKLLALLIVLTLLSFSTREASYYVVIGAFSKETNAKKFTGYARNIYLDAFYKFNAGRNLYYVYVMETSKKDDARNWTLYLKNETRFKDAWVFTETPAGDATASSLDEAAKAHTSPRYSGHDVTPVTKSTVAIASTEDASALAFEHAAEESVTLNAAWTDLDDISFTGDIKNQFSGRKKLAKGDVFTFVAETADGKTIPTDIMLVDYKKAKKLTSFHTGQYIGLESVKRNQSLTLVCDVFGYSVETKTLNLDKISRVRDVKQNAEGVWEVKFRLKPMSVNEISILYNTSFYPDAAVMKPASKAQMDELLALMKANPAYKILIHSHCNPGGRRDIKVAAEQHYFDMEGSHEKNASDKQLTKQRGEAIRAYLVDNGVEGNRVQVFGWGSLDNLVSPSSADPAINERIEVELLQNE